MDLTPPSLTNSPYSPQRKLVDSPPSLFHSLPESSGSAYGNLPSFDTSCSVSSPFGSLIDPSLTQPVDVGSPFAPLDSVPPSVAWTTPNIAAAPSPPSSTTSGSMPNILSEYDTFSHYELLGPYQGPNAGSYSRPASHSPAFMHTPPPSTSDIVSRETTAFPSRGSFGFTHDSVTAKPYGSLQDVPQYPVPRAIATSSHPSRASFGSHASVYLPGGIQPHTQSQSPAPSHMQTPLPSSMAEHGPLQLSSSSLRDGSGSGSGRTWTRMKRAKRRPTRRHTTKEEANFQCMVKGCGKFFSRSYNFKSHMETHDEKREYPFPCQEPNCAKKFVRKTDLQRHHQSVHTKERNHKCDFCSRLFARKDTLRRHMEDGCSKRFEVGMLEAPSETYNVNPPKGLEAEATEMITIPRLPSPTEGFWPWTKTA